MNPTRRFSGRAAVYTRFRPGYPDDLFEWLRRTGLPSAPVAVDLGAGTGISSEFLLRHGFEVTAVEPNDEMRAEAERWLGGLARFHSVAGTAEETGLPSAAFDLAAAFQSAHWFDLNAALEEMQRLSRPGGWMLFAWNLRASAESATASAIENLLDRLAPGYRRYEDRRVVTIEALAGFQTRIFRHEQTLDWESLRGLAQSWSYVPPPGHESHAAFFEELEQIFASSQEAGVVRFLYDCHAYRARRRA